MMTRVSFKFVAAGLLAALLPLGGQTVAAEAPAAIVEDADAGRTDLGLFEMLQSGRQIDLRNGERLVLGYLGSCIRETVTGGKVVIGAKESTVTGGQVSREKVECAGGQVGLDKSSKGKAGVVVFRNSPKKKSVKPKLVVSRDVSPILRMTATTARVSLQRLDQAEPARLVKISGNVLDLRAAGIALAPGGRYEALAGARRVRIEISPDAGADAGLLGRLVIL